MKYIAATDSAFIHQLQILLRSAQTMAGIAPESIKVFLLTDSGYAQNRRRIGTEFPGVEIQPIPLDDPAFDFVRHLYTNGNQGLFFDYVKAYLSIEHAPFLWLDTDIIVRKSLNDLSELIRETQPIIAMAPDFAPGAVASGDLHSNIHRFYQKMYDETHPSVPMSDALFQKKYNAGVLYLNRSVEKEWREIYERTIHLFSSYGDEVDPEKLHPSSADTFGQGIWNTVFWSLNGLELDSEWNNLKAGNWRRKKSIDHYASLGALIFLDAREHDLWPMFSHDGMKISKQIFFAIPPILFKLIALRTRALFSPSGTW